MGEILANNSKTEDDHLNLSTPLCFAAGFGDCAHCAGVRRYRRDVLSVLVPAAAAANNSNSQQQQRPLKRSHLS
ncbi:hypothetical protein TYRP_009897 [Tyrophagus putrescentiae]|nr:hypothetical protein TYRP_009897 [Tyrophagus putrescentiae]